MPVSDEHFVGQADAIIAQQHTRAESLATRAAALTGFAAVAATLVLGATPAGGRSFAVGTYLVAAVLGVCIVLGRQLDRRPDMTTVEELGDAEPAFRLRRLILEKTKCVAEERSPPAGRRMAVAGARSRRHRCSVSDSELPEEPVMATRPSDETDDQTERIIELSRAADARVKTTRFGLFGITRRQVQRASKAAEARFRERARLRRD